MPDIQSPVNRVRRRRVTAIVILVLTAIAAGACGKSVRCAWNLRQGEQALARGDPAAAVERFLAADRLRPDEGRIQLLLARANRRLGQSEAVAERLQKARDCGFDAKQIEREWILFQAQSGLVSKVEPLLSGLLTGAAEDGPEICAAFVSGYIQNYQFEKAMRLLTAWIADYPRDPEPRIALGRIALHWRNAPEAEKQFRKAWELRPDYRGLAGLLCQTLAEQKKFAEALLLVENSPARDRNDDQLRLLQAECLLNLGRQEEAMAVYQELVARSPDNCAALLGLGQGELWHRQPDAALVHLDRALKLCPRNLDARYVRAQALTLHGDRDEAQQELRAVSAARGALVEAGALARKLLDHPDNVDDRFRIATIQLQHGDRSEGVAWLLSILEYDPGHAATHRLLAEYFEEQGDDRRAARHRRALAESEAH